MTHKKYIIVMLIASMIGWLAFWLVVTKLEPCTSPGELTICKSVEPVSLALFFLSIFIAFSATFTLMGFLIRFWMHKDEIYLDHVSISMRQGLLLAISAVGALILLLLETLTWWSGLLLILITLLIELYISRSKE